MQNNSIISKILELEMQLVDDLCAKITGQCGLCTTTNR